MNDDTKVKPRIGEGPFWRASRKFFPMFFVAIAMISVTNGRFWLGTVYLLLSFAYLFANELRKDS